MEELYNKSIFEYCVNGDLENVKLIIEKENINPNIVNNRGNTLLNVASLYDHIDIVKYLVEKCRVCYFINNLINRTPLHESSFGENLEIIKYFVEELNVDINVKDGWSNTPLHEAAYKENIEIMKYFIDLGVDTTIKNMSGNTFFDIIKGECKEIIKDYLLEIECRKLNIKPAKL